MSATNNNQEYVNEKEIQSLPQSHISISDSSENASIADSEFNTRHELKAHNFRKKPEHWTDAYWETITSHYKWFIHIDGNAGCSVCYMDKPFTGNKSLMATMKLKLMNLSYDEFEKKLVEHDVSNPHSKSLKNYNGLRNEFNNSFQRFPNDAEIERSLSETGTKGTYSSEFRCSLCNKEYKLKRSLAKHIFFCNKEKKPNGFQSPCECRGCVLYSIVGIDEHNTTKHSGRYRFNCKICEEQHRTAAIIYGHLLINHDVIWNPYTDMPVKLVLTAAQESTVRSERNKSGQSQQYSERNRNSDQSDSNDVLPKKRTRSATDNKIEKVTSSDDNRETSHLKLSLDQIHNCEYCGGRYLSTNILNEHIRTRHPSVPYAEEVIINPKILVSVSSSDVSHCNLNKKFIDEKTTCIHDNQISACLLTCPLCQKCFATLDLRKDHVSKFHPEIRPFICQHCGLIFTNHPTYNRHMEKSHNCNSLVKPSKNSLVINYSCTFCPLVFTNQADLNHHLNLSHPVPVESVVAEHPEKVETIKASPNHVAKSNGHIDMLLLSLLSANSAESRCPCTVCDSFPHNPYEHALHSLSHSDTEKEEINWQSCPNCSRLFFGEQSKMYLKDHYNIEHLKKPAPWCLQCKESFSSSLVYERHLATGKCVSEGIEEPYAGFMREDKLAFSCAQCGTVFAGQSAEYRLANHSKTCTLELMDDDEFLD